jgi:hypothetical protein
MAPIPDSNYYRAEDPLNREASRMLDKDDL